MSTCRTCKFDSPSSPAGEEGAGAGGQGARVKGAGRSRGRWLCLLLLLGDLLVRSRGGEGGSGRRLLDELYRGFLSLQTPFLLYHPPLLLSLLACYWYAHGPLREKL